MPILDRLRQAWRTRRDRPAPTARAIDTLERAGTITPGEAHALRAGEHLADLYAEVNADEAGVNLERLETIAAHLGAGDLDEAIYQLGHLHPALRDLPYHFDRSTARARA